MDHQEIGKLLARYMAGNLSEGELQQLSDAIREADDTAFEQIMQAHEERLLVTGPLSQPDLLLLERTQQRIADMTPQRSRFRYWAAAAAILLLLAAGTWFYQQRHPGYQTTEIMAAIPKATLTLADGSVIALDSAGNQIIDQAGAAVQQQGGLLVYDPSSSAASVSFNTLSTPRGGQFQVQLPDGSRAWLNAASSIRFPVAFPEGERNVEVTGEVYFEVAGDASSPFTVQVKDRLQVKVLGTGFNINAYADDGNIYTTLLAGKVQVLAGNTLTLQPSQQAVLEANATLVLKDRVDTEQVMAWKNGIFYFADAELRQVMAQLSRWYDVDITFAPNVGKQYFSGKIQRDLGLSQLLSVLDMSDVHYRLEGRKIIIEPATR